MTKILSLRIFVFVAVAVCSPQEDRLRGNWLLTSCQLAVKRMDDHQFTPQGFDFYRVGVCHGLIDGVQYASHKVCSRPDGTHGQKVRVVLKYLQDHPEELDRQGSYLVEKALAKAFPCKRPG